VQAAEEELAQSTAHRKRPGGSLARAWKEIAGTLSPRGPPESRIASASSPPTAASATPSAASLRPSITSAGSGVIVATSRRSASKTRTVFEARPMR
jgi:hypothetical protein